MAMQSSQKSDIFASSSQSENKRADRNSHATYGRQRKKAKGPKGKQSGWKNHPSHAGSRRKAGELRCFDCGELGIFNGDSEFQ